MKNGFSGSANSSDLRPVTIYFEDETISELFCALLEARGVGAEVIDSSSGLADQGKIITEPQFFPVIPESLRAKCLVVGNKEALKGIEAITLSRPLTEDKIETALQEFLKVRAFS